jgi:hypothetical protein
LPADEEQLDETKNKILYFEWERDYPVNLEKTHIRALLKACYISIFTWSNER